MIKMTQKDGILFVHGRVLLPVLRQLSLLVMNAGSQKMKSPDVQLLLLLSNAFRWQFGIHFPRYTENSPNIRATTVII